ncbi:MAG: diguanylate cyclase [Aureliella sp.]
MKKSSVLRINFVVVALCVTALFLASVTGVLPDERRIQSADRSRFCETVAAQLTFLVAQGQTEQVENLIEILCKRNPSVVSVGIRKNDGSLLVDCGQHYRSWQEAQKSQNDGCYVVPIRSTKGDWGSAEIQFLPLYAGVNRIISGGLLKLLTVVVPCVSIACWIFFRRTFRYLDPSRVVPGRVRQTLDSFVEGVLLLDPEGRIMLANEAFQRHVGEENLLGKQIDELRWQIPAVEGGEQSDDHPAVLPWHRDHCCDRALESSTAVLQSSRGYDAVFSVNTSPVLDDQDKYRGMMVAFADVTTLEQKRAELAMTLEDLNRSKDEISIQNAELRYLATRDPLTGCINRRTFYDSFQQLWNACESESAQLNVMMVDIDFFKSINDNYGHSAGDDVLKATGALLLECASDDDIVCRYGGEEFALLVPGCDLEAAAELAEQIRTRLSELQFPDFSITASLGVSAFNLGASDPGDMLDQADKCLYVAKRNGRDQVVRYDTVPPDLIVDQSKTTRVKLDEHNKPAIPFTAVSALLAALSFRDAQTGAHSTRVANYAAAIAQEFLSPRDVYVVEIAGLLHDIGKIGVSDAVLLKPGKLSDEEWEHMRLHDVIGVELVRKSFEHSSLTDIIKHHHSWFDGRNGLPGGPKGREIPVGARILTIADSFDAMVSDRPYRKGMSADDALAELRRCAGTQFDPELVEMFAEVLAAQNVNVESDEAVRLPAEVVASLGEQVERIVGAVEDGDTETFRALADRIRTTAEQNGVAEIASAASHAVDVASEDIELAKLAEESFALLRACRSIHSNVADASAGSRPQVPTPTA